MDLLYHVYCVVAFPIWIAAISLPNLTTETNSNAFNGNITDNKVADDIKTSVVLNTGNDSTESNLFPNLESSTMPRTTNYIHHRDKTSIDKDLLTKNVITEGSIQHNKNMVFHTSESSETSTHLVPRTQIPEITSRHLETTEHNMADRDIQPNNVYNISLISTDTNNTTNDSTVFDTTSKSAAKTTTATTFIQNESTENNMTSQETTTILQTTVTETTEASATESSTTKTSTQYDTIQYTTEFAQNVPIGHHHKKHKKPMHHLNLVPIEDGPFGSLIWKDKKYLISVLVPIGIGIIGAGCIIGMAYVVRFCQKTEQQVQRLRQALVEPKEERNDQIVLLVNSSDDDF